MQVTITITVKGPTGEKLKQQLTKEFDELTRAELAKYMQRDVDKANKRLRRIESADMTEWSPAYKHAMQEGLFKTGGKNLNELRHEYARLQAYLNAKTSTITEVRKYKKATEERLMERLGTTDKECVSQFYDRLHSIEELRPDIFAHANYMSEIQGIVQESLQDADFEQKSQDEQLRYIDEALAEQIANAHDTIAQLSDELTDVFDL